MVAKIQQPLTRRRRQRARVRRVEAQLHRARDLIDVLPARALRADRRELELRGRNRHAAADAQPFFAGRISTVVAPNVERTNGALTIAEAPTA